MQTKDSRLDYGKMLSRIMSGLLGLGGVFGAFRDADFVTWQIALAGTLVMIGGWIGTQFYLKRYPIRIGSYNIKKLKGYYAWPLVGMAVLLWLTAAWPDPVEPRPEPVEVIVLQTSTPQPLPTDTPMPTPTLTITPLPFPPEEEAENLIVILKFARTEGVIDVNPHVEIRDSIENQLQQLNLNQQIRVEIVPSSVDPLSRPEEARREAESIANLYNASLVIWGIDTGIRTRVGFANLKPGYTIASQEDENDFGNLFQSFDTTGEAQLTAPQEYSEFILEKLPSGLEFLTFYALGFVAYFDNDFGNAEILLEQAIEAFSHTEYDAREFRLDQAYVVLGGAQLSLGKVELTFANVDNALQVNPQNVLAMLLGVSAAGSIRDHSSVELQLDRMHEQCVAFIDSLNAKEISVCAIAPMVGSVYFTEIDEDFDRTLKYLQLSANMIEDYGDKTVFSGDNQQQFLDLANLMILSIEAEKALQPSLENISPTFANGSECNENLDGETIILHQLAGREGPVAAILGEAFFFATNAALTVINNNGGICGAILVVEFNETNYDAAEEVEIYEKIRNEAIVILTYAPGTAITLAERLNEDHILSFTTGVNSSAVYGTPNGYTIGAVPISSDQFTSFVKWVTDNWVDIKPATAGNEPVIGVIGWPNSYGTGATTEEALAYINDELGVTVLPFEEMPINPEADVSGQIQNLLMQGANVIYNQNFSFSTAQVIGTIQAIGVWDDVIVGGVSWSFNQDVLSFLGDNIALADGYYGVMPHLSWDDTDEEIVQEAMLAFDVGGHPINERTNTYLLTYATFFAIRDILIHAINSEGYINLSGATLLKAAEDIGVIDVRGLIRYDLRDGFRAPRTAQIMQWQLQGDSSIKAVQVVDFFELPDTRP